MWISGQVGSRFFPRYVTRLCESHLPTGDLAALREPQVPDLTSMSVTLSAAKGLEVEV